MPISNTGAAEVPPTKVKPPKKKSTVHTDAGHGSTILPDHEKLLSERVKQAAAKQRSTEPKRPEAISASVTLALAQALRSEDLEMLDQILASTPDKIRTPSVARLDPDLAIVLLRRCAFLFQTNATRAQQVMPWIRDLLIAHSIFFMSLPEVGDLLMPIHHVVREHLATFERLRQLQGRLDLLLSRLPHIHDVAVNPIPLQAFEEPALQDSVDLNKVQQLLLEAIKNRPSEGVEDEEAQGEDEEEDEEPEEAEGVEGEGAAAAYDALDAAIDNAERRPIVEEGDEDDLDDPDASASDVDMDDGEDGGGFPGGGGGRRGFRGRR